MIQLWIVTPGTAFSLMVVGRKWILHSISFKLKIKGKPMDLTVYRMPIHETEYIV